MSFSSAMSQLMTSKLSEKYNLQHREYHMTGAFICILLVNTVNATPFEGTMRSINTPCSHCVRLTDTDWLLWLTLSVPAQGVRVREALAGTTEEGLCQKGVEGRRISTRV